MAEREESPAAIRLASMSNSLWPVISAAIFLSSCSKRLSGRAVFKLFFAPISGSGRRRLSTFPFGLSGILSIRAVTDGTI